MLLDPAFLFSYIFLLSLGVLSGWEKTMKHNFQLFFTFSTTPPAGHRRPA
jgi:hypothetical protein